MKTKDTGITDLRVIWKGAGVVPELEDDIRELMAKWGLECWAQGFDFVDHERDLAFRPSPQ